jgi:hypothetical protein
LRSQPDNHELSASFAELYRGVAAIRDRLGSGGFDKITGVPVN